MAFNLGILEQQRSICIVHSVPFVETPTELKVGIALNVKDLIQPINGLRHTPEGDTSGWYIWAGQHLSAEPQFFKPLHAGHLVDWCPAILKFLGLPPGWRFLIADGYEDVWFDPTLLNVTKQD